MENLVDFQWIGPLKLGLVRFDLVRLIFFHGSYCHIYIQIFDCDLALIALLFIIGTQHSEFLLGLPTCYLCNTRPHGCSNKA